MWKLHGCLSWDLMVFYGEIYNFYNLRIEFKLVAAVLTDIIYGFASVDISYLVG